MSNNPALAGLGNSQPGTLITAADTEFKDILRIAHRRIDDAACMGMASVQVHVTNRNENPQLEIGANASLVLFVKWQSGASGGEMHVDATRGATFALNGTNSIEIYARYESAVLGQPLVTFCDKFVEANVQWLGSISPKECFRSLPTVGLAPGVPSDWYLIPKMALGMLAFSTTPANYPTLLAEFSTVSNNVTGSLKYATLNPNANGSPIMHGVEFVRFTSPVEMDVFPMFELIP